MDNVGTIYKQTMSMNDEKVAKECLSFIDEHTAEVLLSESIKPFESNFLKELLTRDSLQIDEAELFKAVGLNCC